ncbi:hypothetical protein M0R45_036412 [Rubus argutus]|uniref:Uncharacterized protein n=1 Tax=Rubus argutus TaxID=59490 RepID=A0AAW1W1H2_RUBAR
MGSDSASAVVLGKRIEQDHVLSVSPKKLKSLLKVHHSIVGKEAFSLVIAEDKCKKKWGRPVGAKNKKFGAAKDKAKVEIGPLRLTYLIATLPLRSKGKKKI